MESRPAEEMEMEMEKKKESMMMMIIDREVVVKRRGEGVGLNLMEKILKWGDRLRLCCSLVCLGALLVIIFSKQTIDIGGGFIIKARYHYSNAFTFLAGVDGVVCGCSLISVIYVFLLSRSKPHPNSCFKLFVHDLAMLLLMVAGCAAGTSIGYIGKYGQAQSGWSPICDQVKKFCFKITISLVLSYIALICYLLLTILSVLKIKNTATGSNRVDIPTQALMPIANN